MARYVPILRWKRGERVALQNVSAAMRQGVVPQFLVPASHYLGKEANASRAAVTPADKLAEELEDVWGVAPFYLDASALPDNPNGHHPLVDIAASARALGLRLIPSTPVNTATPAYLNAVNVVAAVDHRGAALQVDLAGMASAATWIGNWQISINQTDLIADFGDAVRTVYALGTTIVNAFQSLHAASSWRTVTVAGTSMPENFGGFAAGLHTIPRTEILLWRQLAAAHLPFSVDYGDYTTVPTNTPPPGIKWGYPINVRYTLDTDFLICRGVGTTGLGGVDMDQQLVGHARSIVAYPNRNPLVNCWADERINQIAASGAGQSNLEGWVQIGVNRHIEYTRSRLP